MIEHERQERAKIAARCLRDQDLVVANLVIGMRSVAVRNRIELLKVSLAKICVAQQRDRSALRAL